MSLSRRSFFRQTAAGLGTVEIGSAAFPAQERGADLFRDLKNLTTGIPRLTKPDFESRLELARKLMTDQKVSLLYLNAGTTMEYFSGIRWGLSERMFAMLIPAKGEIAFACPKFEEGRGREQIATTDEIRTWEEDEDPYLTVRQILEDRKISTGTIAIEPSVRYFLVDGLQKACPAARCNYLLL